MKAINVTFEDKEHEELSKKKGELSWHDFILKLIEDNELGGNKNGKKT
jgi:predicted CopG family antitoxin